MGGYRMERAGSCVFPRHAGIRGSLSRGITQNPPADGSSSYDFTRHAPVASSFAAAGLRLSLTPVRDQSTQPVRCSIAVCEGRRMICHRTRCSDASPGPGPTRPCKPGREGIFTRRALDEPAIVDTGSIVYRSRAGSACSSAAPCLGILTDSVDEARQTAQDFTSVEVTSCAATLGSSGIIICTLPCAGSIVSSRP